MSESWTNAVITLRVRIDPPAGSWPKDKSECALAAFERICPDLPDDVVATIGCEDVNDGQSH